MRDAAFIQSAASGIREEFVNSLPWYGSYGGCTLLKPNDENVRKDLLLKYAEHLKDDDLLSATLILSPFENEYFRAYQDVVNTPFIDERIGQITFLPRSSERAREELAHIVRKKMRNVNKATRQGFTVRVVDEEWAWRFLYETHVENIEAIGGKTKLWEHFDAMRRSLPSAFRKIYVAMLQATPIAALLVIFFNRTVEYITPVIKHDYRPLQPLSLIIFNAMLDSIKSGFQHWNWGGTWVTQQTLHRFKAGWGAVDHPYSYLIHASERSRELIKRNRDKISQAFPYYYVFPFDQLT